MLIRFAFLQNPLGHRKSDLWGIVKRLNQSITVEIEGGGQVQEMFRQNPSILWWTVKARRESANSVFHFHSVGNPEEKKMSAGDQENTGVVELTVHRPQISKRKLKQQIQNIGERLSLKIHISRSLPYIYTQYF